MKKLIFTSALFMFFTLGSNAQWTQTGTNLYPTNLNSFVGIGHASPSQWLHVAKSGVNEPTILVENTNATALGGATFRMKDASSGADFKFKSTQFGDFKIRDQSNALDVFFIKGDGTGYVGIGTNAPTTKLDVSGNILGIGSTGLGDFAVKGLGGNSPTNGYLGVVGSIDFEGDLDLDIGGREIGVLGISTGSSNTDNYGVFGHSNYWGGHFQNKTSGNMVSLGGSTKAIEVSGDGSVSGKLGVGTTSTSAKLQVQGGTSDQYGIIVDTDYTGASNKYGIYTDLNSGGTGVRYGAFTAVTANSANNSNIYGVRSLANGNGNDGTVYGLYSSVSTSGTGNRYGIYSFASTTSPSPTTESWALYSNGYSYFSSDVRMGWVHDVPGYRLSVNGKIICEELLIQDTGNWPDYVFEEDYDLLPIKDVEQYIANNKHLPGIPSAACVESDGITIGEISKTLVKKMEELTLYVIQQQKEIENLKKLNAILMDKMEE